MEAWHQAAIEAAIERLYRSWSDGDLGVSPNVRTETLRRFSRPGLARQLASVLEAAAEDRVQRASEDGAGGIDSAAGKTPGYGTWAMR